MDSELIVHDIQAEYSPTAAEALEHYMHKA